MVVLVVDDVSMMRNTLVDVLVNTCGIEKANIHEAADGRIAVQEYTSKKPDIVFLDILMPVQDGSETVKKLIELDSNAYIIMCSSANDANVVRDCVKNGALDYIVKPISPERVQIAIDKFRAR